MLTDEEVREGLLKLLVGCARTETGLSPKFRFKLWTHVISHFAKFLGELELKTTERQDGESKADRVARSLFADYYPGQPFNSACYSIVGSYAKGTAARPRSDVDMIFVIPSDEFSRINSFAGNKQSQLLQEVKYSLLETYPNTDIRGDGPVVKVPFSSYYFEVCPVFALPTGSFITAHTKNGGWWGYTNPVAEINWLRTVDTGSHGKASQLVKMAKAWQRECNVEIKSICLETLAILFVDQWVYKTQTTLFWHDWMIRDFFDWVHQFSICGKVRPAGIDEWIPAGDCWQTKCLSAYRRALKACEYEHDDCGTLAIDEWQRIFGYQFRHNLLVPPPPLILPANLLAGIRA
jgi:hypothetical protein